jgi:hypothetical protein
MSENTGSKINIEGDAASAARVFYDALVADGRHEEASAFALANLPDTGDEGYNTHYATIAPGRVELSTAQNDLVFEGEPLAGETVWEPLDLKSALERARRHNTLPHKRLTRAIAMLDSVQEQVLPLANTEAGRLAVSRQFEKLYGVVTRSIVGRAI